MTSFPLPSRTLPQRFNVFFDDEFSDCCFFLQLPSSLLFLLMEPFLDFTFILLLIVVLPGPPGDNVVVSLCLALENLAEPDSELLLLKNLLRTFLNVSIFLHLKKFDYTILIFPNHYYNFKNVLHIRRGTSFSFVKRLIYSF